MRSRPPRPWGWNSSSTTSYPSTWMGASSNPINFSYMPPPKAPFRFRLIIPSLEFSDPADPALFLRAPALRKIPPHLLDAAFVAMPRTQTRRTNKKWAQGPFQNPLCGIAERQDDKPRLARGSVAVPLRCGDSQDTKKPLSGVLYPRTSVAMLPKSLIYW